MITGHDCNAQETNKKELYLIICQNMMYVVDELEKEVIYGHSIGDI